MHSFFIRIGRNSASFRVGPAIVARIKVLGEGVSDKLTDSIVAVAVGMAVLVAVCAAIFLRGG